MVKKVVLAGLAGAITLLAWYFITNAIFGFRNRIDMKQVPDEKVVYELLREEIKDPGRYTCNPPLDDKGMFPIDEPVFGILYGGMGHEAAGKLMIMDLLLALVSSTLAAWLLSMTSRRVLSSYPRKVLFFIITGLLIALLCDIDNYGIGNYPFGDALLLALNRILSLTVTGLVIAAIIKPAGKSEIKA